MADKYSASKAQAKAASITKAAQIAAKQPGATVSRDVYGGEPHAELPGQIVGTATFMPTSRSAFSLNLSESVAIRDTQVAQAKQQRQQQAQIQREQQLRAEARLPQGVPTEIVTKPKGKQLRIDLSERVGISQGKREIPPSSAGLLYGAETAKPIYDYAIRYYPEKDIQNLVKSFAEIPRGFKDIIEGKVTQQGPFGIPAPEPPSFAETASTKAFEGRFSEIDLTKPEDQASLAFTGGLIVAPVPAIKGIKPIEAFTKGQKAKAVGKAVQEPGVIQGVEKFKSPDFYEIAKGTEGRGITVTTKREPILQVTRKTQPKKIPGTDIPVQEPGIVEAKFTKAGPTKIPAISKQPIVETTFVRFGKESKFVSGDVIEIIKPKPGQLPKEIVFRGPMAEATVKQLGLKTRGESVFTKEAPTPQDIAFLEQATKQGYVKQIAEGRIAPVKEVIRKQTNELQKFVTGPRQTRVRFYQTQAQPGQPKGSVGGPFGQGLSIGSRTFERELRSLGLGTKQTRGFRKGKPLSFEPIKEGKGGAGAIGKSQALTKDQRKFIKSYFEPKQQTKQRQDYLGPILPPIYRQGQQTEQQYYRYPSEQKEGIGISDLLKTQKSSLKETKEKLGITDYLDITVKRGIKTIPTVERFKITDVLQTRLVKPKPITENVGLSDLIKTSVKQGQKPLEGFVGITDVVTVQRIPGPPPPDFPPPPRPPEFVPPGGLPFGIPPSTFYSGGYGSGRGTKKYFETFGISSDIGIKYLPETKGHPFQKVSTSSKIFKQLESYDKAVQRAVYGTPRKQKAKVSRGRRK